MVLEIGLILDRILSGVRTLFDLNEKYQIKKVNEHRQKMFELTLKSMYELGGHKERGVDEYSLNKIQGLSKMDLFESLDVADRRGFLIDASSHDGNAWLLSQDGIRYTKALLEQPKK